MDISGPTSMIRHMRHLCICGSIVLALGSGAEAHNNRLLTEQVEGASRVCVYQPDIGRFDPARAITFRIGRGEPCPQTYSEQIPTGRENEIPAMASLSAEEEAASGTVCVYRYLNREYRRNLRTRDHCTLTAALSGGDAVTTAATSNRLSGN